MPTLLSLATLLKIPQGKSYNNSLINPKKNITGISTDSRNLESGEVFIALRGDNFNGEDFIQDAVTKGASCIISSKYYAEYAVPQLVVSDALECMHKIAAYIRSKWQFPVIAITGSCGKTTTKEMLKAILLHAGYKVLASEKNYNNHIGVPLTIFASLKEDVTIAVLELGMNHPGEIAQLTKLVKPNIAVVTTVAPVHIGHFCDEAAIYAEKVSIFNALPADGTAIFNADNKFYANFQQQFAKNKSIAFGIQHPGDVAAQNISLDQDGCASFDLQIKQQQAACKINISGEHQVYNALAAASCCVAQGINIELIAAGLAKLNAVTRRMNIQYSKSGMRIIDDSYSANYVACKAAIDLLQHFSGKKIMVLADMEELGNDSEYYHSEVGKYAKAQGVDYLLCLGKYSRHAKDAFGDNASHFLEKASLITSLQALVDNTFSVLVKGSNCHKTWEVIDSLSNI